MKLHTTSSADIIQECRVMFGVKSVSKSIFFLLGNGQTYATRGVPYFRVSRIFMSRIFHPCILVPHFHVPQFHVSHFQRPRLHIVQYLSVTHRHRIKTVEWIELCFDIDVALAALLYG